MAKVQKKGVATKKTKAAAKKTTARKVEPKKAAKKAAPQKASVASTGITKEYPKGKNVCKVTFRLPRIAATGAKNVCIVGDFNNWNIYANPMKKLRNGNYTISLELEPGREYQFRYFVDESKWENDWSADKYVKSPYGDSDNSVVII